MELFQIPDGGLIGRYSFNNNVYSYGIDDDRKRPLKYSIISEKMGEWQFLSPNVKYSMPKWVEKK